MKKRMLAILLALLMIAPTIVSCSESAVNDETDPVSQDSVSDAASETEPETMEGYDVNGFLLDDLPDDLDFEGQQVTVLYWEDVENPEFFVEDFNGEPVNDAIHQRNINVEDRLNMTYNYVGTPGNLDNKGSYVMKARDSYMAGDGAYDIYASYTASVAACTANGLTKDISDSAYLDFEKPWWPENLVEESTVGKALFFVSGDISTNILHMMYGIFYNDKLIESYQIEDPVELVRAGTWTIDKLINMTTGTYRDLDGDGKKNGEDFFGFGQVDWHGDAFYTGSGLKLVDKDEENFLKISDDFFSEKTVNLIEKLGTWVDTNDVIYTGDFSRAFAEERTIFIVNRVYYASNWLRDTDVKYGVVPVPKYDEAQEQYNTVVGHPMTLYAVSIDSKLDDEITHSVLECAASQAHRLTTPAVFENNMKKKFSYDDVDAQMFDLIRSCITFDLGRFFVRELNSITDTFTGAVSANRGNWASMAAKTKQSLDKAMSKLLGKIEERYS